MGQLFPIKMPPGMFRNGTEYESAGRWFDGNLVRWENGRLKPIGGWQALLAASAPPLQGVARGGLAFTDNFGFPYTLIGTNSNLYIGEGGAFSDVTPVGFVAGRVDSILGAGYGAGTYGTSTYGTPRAASTLPLIAATWQMDTFGNTAVMVQSTDRKLYQFDPATGLVTVPAGSPTCVAVFTTNEDFLLVIGAGGVGRKIQWPDIGTTTIWTPSDVNSAGDIDLNTQGLGMAGARVGLQNLVWTTTDVHLVNYVGQPAIYAPIRIGTACGLIGPRAWAVAASGVGAGEAAYWMSPGGFFTYTGTVTPLPCEVQDFLWANINFTQAAKIYASPNSRFHEIIWFFPSLNSQEVDSYVMYNYKDNIWYFGLQSLLARTTYIDLGALPLPVGVAPPFAATDTFYVAEDGVTFYVAEDGISSYVSGVGGSSANSVIYEHETGVLANGASRVGHIFVQSGPFEIGNGDQVIYSNMMLIDGDNITDSTLTMTPQGRLNPQSPVMAADPIACLPNAEGYTPVRFSGRQIALRFDAAKDKAWSLGKFRLNVVGGSKR